MPSKDNFIHASPYPQQRNVEPFLYQGNYGGIIRKNLNKHSQRYLECNNTAYDSSGRASVIFTGEKNGLPGSIAQTVGRLTTDPGI